ncbi:LSM domain-containing protein [Aureococcus anophagefferens]|nr:LSM domain-containing protein [Aureococcus anophagefferens]
MEAVTPADGAAKNLLRGISRVCCGDNVSHSVIGRFSNAADRRKLQDDAGKLARHRMRALRSDLVDLACAREYWHQNDDVRLDTFAGRCTKKVKIVTVQVDSDGRRTLVVKEEHHQRHTKHAGDLEIYQAFLKSAGYASHLAAHPSHKISFTLFKRAKCPCIAV